MYNLQSTAQKIIPTLYPITYHQKFYNVEHVASDGYMGGLNEYNCWLSKADLLAAIEALGFKVLKVIDDAGEPGSHIASINLWLDHVDEEKHLK